MTKVYNLPARPRVGRVSLCGACFTCRTPSMRRVFHMPHDPMRRVFHVPHAPYAARVSRVPHASYAARVSRAARPLCGACFTCRTPPMRRVFHVCRTTPCGACFTCRTPSMRRVFHVPHDRQFNGPPLGGSLFVQVNHTQKKYSRANQQNI